MHELQTFKKVWSYTASTCLFSGSSLRNGANSPKDVGVGTDHTFLKFETCSSLGRPRCRWEDYIKMDLREVGGGCGD